VKVIEAREVAKELLDAGGHVAALQDVSLDVEAGELVSITGESGSGKSTLLSLLGAIDRPTRGSIRLLGHALESASTGHLARLRREHVGFVFQDFLLVRHLSALDNVRLPFLLGDRPGARDPSRELLARFDLAHRARHVPDALSRGEMQRVALARALVNAPRVLFADEPTANLDARNREAIWDHLTTLNERDGRTIIVATHDAALAARTRRTVRLHDGRIVADEMR
jgi:ABC-type lipoprotein export system ATPase subunit